MIHLPIWKQHLPPFLVGILSEVILWSAILFLVYNLGDRFVDWLELPFATGAQTIEVYFNDVSQLGAGSPVRWMGVDVGYVSHVKPEKGRVRVIAQIKPGTAIIPRGSHFTVEFNGLAGSKSLEIIPPKRAARAVVGEAIEGYDIEEPIRIQDVMDTQMIVADAMEHSMHNIEKSLTQLERSYEVETELQEVLSIITHFDRNMMRFDQQMQAFHRDLRDQSREILSTLAEAQRPLDELDRRNLPTREGAQDLLDTTERLMSELESVHTLLPGRERVQRWREASTMLRQKLEKLGSKTSSPTTRSRLQGIQRSLESLNTSKHAALEDPQQDSDSKSVLEVFEGWVEQSQEWVKQSEKVLNF
jgi:ABC-type transporter Mla subunit MlaD